MATGKIAYVPDPEMSFWPTPWPVADDLVFSVMESWMLPAGEGVRVLEPSAGEGALVRAVRARLPAAWVTAVEPDLDRAGQLRKARAGVEPVEPATVHAGQRPGRLLADEVVHGTLEDYLAGVAMAAFAGEWRPFDVVVANPPFTLPGRPEAWAEHMLALYHDPHLLGPGAVIAAVAPHVVLTGKSRLVRAVRAVVGGAERCERAAFAPVGAQVSTALIWAQKPYDGEQL